MSEAFLGEVRIFSFAFAPKNWAQCNGQLMSIQQNTALFSLLGTYYGGNGVQTFGLPNLQGRMTLGYGNSFAGNFVIGQTAGEVTHTLTNGEMPAHTHLVTASAAAGTQLNPQGNVSAEDPGGSPMFGSTANTTLNPGAVAPSGGNLPHNNMQPYSVLNFCIALAGIFPSRN
jgi:microcystin-dependent protein